MRTVTPACRQVGLSAAEPSIHAPGVFLATARDRAAHEELQKTKDTWYRMLWHF